MELPGLGGVPPADNPELAGGTEGQEKAETETRDEKRSPFAMGKLSRRTTEIHMARGDSEGPIPGPWKLRAVVGPGPGNKGSD